MQDKYVEYTRCPDMESAIGVAALLEKNHIDFEIDNSALRFQLVPSAGLVEVIIRVKQADFERAMNLLPSENLSDVKEKPYESYSDDRGEEQEEHFIADNSVVTKTADGAAVLLRGLFSVLIFFIIVIQGTDLKFALILVTVLFIHELGHFIAMKRFHYTDVKIFFIPFFGAATSGKPVVTSQRKESIVLLAGPLPGIIAGICLMHFTDNPDNSNVLYLAGKIFVVLNMFNLLPVFPMDGGKLVANIFLRRANIIVLKLFYVFSIAAFVYFALKWGEYWLLFIALIILPLLFKKKNKPEEPVSESIATTPEVTLTNMQFHEKLLLIIVWIACLYAPIYMGFPNFLF